jgi:hypothetical protein
MQPRRPLARIASSSLRLVVEVDLAEGVDHRWAAAGLVATPRPREAKGGGSQRQAEEGAARRPSLRHAPA